MILIESLRSLFTNNHRQEWIDSHKTHMNIRDYTDGELYRDIESAESMPTPVLAVICAEILRRQKEKDEVSAQPRN
jgi:hypothetical protein